MKWAIQSWRRHRQCDGRFFGFNDVFGFYGRSAKDIARAVNDTNCCGWMGRVVGRVREADMRVVRVLPLQELYPCLSALYVMLRMHVSRERSNPDERADVLRNSFRTRVAGVRYPVA